MTTVRSLPAVVDRVGRSNVPSFLVSLDFPGPRSMTIESRSTDGTVSLFRAPATAWKASGLWPASPAAMTRRFRMGRLGILSALGAIALNALAQTPPALPDPRTFGVELVQAIRSGQGERRLSVVHPMSRRCVTTSTQSYYDWWFEKQRRVLGASHPIVKVDRFDAATVTPPTDGRSDYPIVPTHRLQIDFSDGPYQSSGLIAYVAPDRGRWREVLPCPRGDVVERARHRVAEDQEQAGRVRSQLPNMPPALQRELRALLDDGRKVDAIRRYAAATGEDLGTAKAVVESLGAAGKR